MSTPRSNRRSVAPRRPPIRRTAAFLLLACVPLAAHALSSDRQKQMVINADYSKIVQSKDGNAPGVTYLSGNVTMDQGTTKVRADEATIYQHAANAKDAQGKDISGDVQRVVLVGKKKQAHLEQQQDSGGLMRADSDKIDYDADTSVAVLTGNVVVVQPGRGEFRGAYMTYNTNTGEMESGDKSSSGSRVHMVIEPKNKTSAPAEGQPAPKPAASEGKPAGGNRR
jgi:lipopolysaccharide export system protein LptA